MGRFRKDRLASTIREVISDAIASELSDPRISTLTSVTRVHVPPDLQCATVYISVIGTEGDERKTLTALRHATGHLRSALAKVLSMRQCPELRFEVDHSLKRAAETQRIIAESIREDQALSEARARAQAEDAESGPANGVAP